MSQVGRMWQDTRPYDARFREAVSFLKNADMLLIGAGAGFSAAAGLLYSGSRFTDNFADFIRAFKLRDMYTAGFFEYPTPLHRWAYFSREIKLNRYDAVPGKVYSDLRELAECLPKYFVLTTNVDSFFPKSGFSADRFFATQGDYGNFQCAKPCRLEVWSNEAEVKAMVAQQHDMQIPEELTPKCPFCGGPAAGHLRADDKFVEDAAWEEAAQRFAEFLREAQGDGKRLVMMDLGSGFNTPSIVRWRLERIAANQPNARLIRINRDESGFQLPLGDRAVGFSEDVNDLMPRLLAAVKA